MNDWAFIVAAILFGLVTIAYVLAKFPTMAVVVGYQKVLLGAGCTFIAVGLWLS